VVTHSPRRLEASVSEERKTMAEDEIKHLKQELTVRNALLSSQCACPQTKACGISLRRRSRPKPASLDWPRPPCTVAEKGLRHGKATRPRPPCRDGTPSRRTIERDRACTGMERQERSNEMERRDGAAGRSAGIQGGMLGAGSACVDCGNELTWRCRRETRTWSVPSRCCA
jgi:hypothetical protein